MDCKWIRVTKQFRCPICGKHDWCMVSQDGTAAICSRVPSPKVVGDKGAGWLHELENKIMSEYLDNPPPEPPPPDFGVIQEYYLLVTKAVTLARDIGVSAKSLARLNVGWDANTQSDTFPMKNAKGKIIGIRKRRRIDGQYLCTKGSKEGLFIPAGLDPSKPLAIVEGATDTAAMLDLGFECMGRPNNLGGLHIIMQILNKYQPKFILVVSDNDEINPATGKRPGDVGAEQLMTKMTVSMHYSHRHLCISPPLEYKDVRKWLQAGAKHQDVRDVIKNVMGTGRSFDSGAYNKTTG